MHQPNSGWERWKPVHQYETLYLVSDWGRVMRIRPKSGTSVGHILKPPLNRGRRRVLLSDYAGDNRHHHVAVLIAEAFLGKRPPGMEVNHLDGIKDHDCEHNLEWVTASQNMKHAVLNGLVTPPTGPNKKLTPAAVRIIKTSDDTRQELATRFGVTEWTIRDILKGRTWQHVVI